MLKDQIEKALLTARLDVAKKKPNADVAKETLTLLKASIQNEAIKNQAELSDEEIVTIVKSNVKQLNQTLDSAKVAERQELIEKTEAQIALLSVYLPQTMTEDQILDYLKDNFSVDMPFGQAMGKIMKDLSGKIDGATAKSALQKYLQK